MPTLPTTAKSRQPTPKAASSAVPKGLSPKTRGQAGPLPRKPKSLKTRGTPNKRAASSKLPSFGSAGIPGATDITPPSAIGSLGGGAPGSLPSFTAPPRPMNMPNMGLGNAGKMTLSRDKALDKKAGIKPGSKKDNALDRKRGVSTR